MRELKNIEQLMKEQSKSQSFDFKDTFWEDMSSMLDTNDVVPSNPSSDSIDKEAESSIVSEVNKQGFDYKEAYWNEMSAALDRNERSKKLILWSKMLGAAAVIGIISLTAYFMLDSKNNSSPDYSMLNQNSSFDRQEFGAEKQTDKAIGNSSLGTSMISDSSSGNVLEDLAKGKSYYSNKHKTINTNRQHHKNELYTNNKVSKQIDDVAESMKESQLDEVMFLRQPIPVIGKSNGASTEELIMLPELNTARTFKLSTLSVHAGALLANAPNTGIEEASKLGYGFKGGLSYQFRKKIWGLETGLNFIYRTGLNQEFILNSSRYGMHVFREENKTTYKSMMSLEIPLMATVQLKRHRIGLGMSGVYNFAVNSTLNRSNNISDEKEIIRNNYSNEEGMNKFDARLQMNYEFKINKRFDVGLTAQYGLLNQVNRSVVTNSDGYNELNASVYLKVNIFNF